MQLQHEIAVDVKPAVDGIEGARMEPRKAVKPSWSNQFLALTKKNFIVVLRKPALLATTILLPCLAFLAISSLSNAITKSQDDTAAIQNLFMSSTPLSLTTSNRILYTPSNPQTDAIMTRLCAMSGLTLNADVIPYASLSALTSDILNSYSSLASKREWAVIKFADFTNATVAYTLLSSNPVQGRVGSRDTSPYASRSVIDQRDPGNPFLRTLDAALQVAVDAAVVSLARDPSPGANAAPADFVQSVWDFFRPGGNAADDLQTEDPYGSDPVKAFTVQLVVDLLLRPILAVSFLPVMVLVLDVVSKEKQKRLLGPLRRMGLRESAFWIAMLPPFLVIAIVVSVAAAGCAKLVGGSVSAFAHVTFEVLAVVNFCYVLAMLGFGILWSAVVSRPIFVNLIVGATGATTVVLDLVAFLGFGTFPFQGSIWFNNCQATYAKVLLFLLAPYFSYSKIWNDILLVTNPSTMNNQTSSTFDLPQLIYTNRSVSAPAGRTLQRSDLIDVQNYAKADSAGLTALLLLLSLPVYIVLAIYLNQALPSIDGHHLPWYFPFTSAYWTSKPSARKTPVPDTLTRERDLSAATQSVRIVKLSKQYPKGATAVREFSATLERGRVHAILGHNGAGKTSLINMLSLTTSITHGECFMFGADLRESSTQDLGSLMALCPQFDVLYPALTAWQHVKFYVGFRGEVKGSKEELERFIMGRLEMVDLHGVAHKKAGTFSGGMKRRLRLDPLSRRKCWKLIQELKRDRVVVLTTHSMEEADELGDHISIMHQGRLRAAGSSLFLKNRFGKGYQLSIVNRAAASSGAAPLAISGLAPGSPTAGEPKSSDSDAVIRSALEQYVTYALPGSEVVSSAAGALTVSVSRQSSRRLAEFLRALRADNLPNHQQQNGGKPGSGMEWSISNSTLEEVFLKLCSDNKAVVADNEGDDTRTQEKRRICCLCGVRESDVVTLFTRLGVRVTIPYFVCQPCADGTAADLDGRGDGVKGQGVDAVGPGAGGIVPFSQFVRSLPAQYHLAANAAGAEDLARASAGGFDTKEVGAGALFGRQVMAVVRKNAQLHGKERKMNWCFAIFVIIFNAIALIVGKAPTNLKNVAGGGGGGLDFSDAPVGCGSVVFSNPHYTASCSPSELESMIRSIPNACIPGTSQSRQDGMGFESMSSCAGGTAQPLNFTTSPLFFVYGGSTRGIQFGSELRSGPNAKLEQLLAGDGRYRVSFAQQASSGDLDIASLFDPSFVDSSIMDPINATDRLSTPELFYDDSPYTAPPLLTRVAGAESAQAAFSAAQANLVAGAAPLPDLCGGFGGASRRGVLASQLGTLQQTWRNSYPDLGITVDRMKASSSGINVKYELVHYPPVPMSSPYPNLFVTDPLVNSLLYNSNCSAVSPNHPSYGRDASSDMSRKTLTTVNAITNGILSTLNSSTYKSVVSSLAYLPPFITAADESDINFAVRAIFFAVTLMFFFLTTGLMFPRLITLLVLEKRENLVEMMRIQGLDLFKYWVGFYVYGFITTLALNLVYLIIALGMGYSNVVAIGALNMVGVLLLWTHAQVCIVILIAALVTKPVSAGLVGYLVFILTAVISPFVTITADRTTGSLPLGFSLFPPTGIASLLNILVSNVDTSPIKNTVLVVILSSTFYGLLGCYIHAIRPSPVGVPVDPLLGLSKYLRRSARDNDVQLGRHRNANQLIDSDVLEEEHRVLASAPDASTEALRVTHLRKTFGSKVAVDDVTLSVKYGETFGLLGPNGAGKTTTLSMITGLLKRTSGSITVAGKAIDDARGNGQFWRLIGVTPQFDTVWPDLTVEEHLKFYCRLRGVPSRNVQSMVRGIAEDVELDGDAFRVKASGLSGGMRRRLSIGIALTASPRILVLDEPTTGLDPETKRHVWRIVDRVRRGGAGSRCVVITTHSMEEADALCSRIGIVCDGNLKVLGSQIHLKKKFGEGLKLTLRFSVEVPAMQDAHPPSIDALARAQQGRVNGVLGNVCAALGLGPAQIDSSVTSSDLNIAHANALASASLGVPRAGDVTWMVTVTSLIAKDAVDIADVFLALEDACMRSGVGDFALNETTLEDVFVRVAEGRI
ncbi:hypothetical protein HK101_005457 [Irineochytrium annulatum]|nr:hypothetical protein HK101_005457 [Irineochytrium annulatum]